MTAVLLANIGHRDLLQSGQKIEPAREEGKRILESLDAVKAYLSTPLLWPAVELLIGKHKELQLVLWGTDQPEGTASQHRAGDTIYIAEVVARLLAERTKQIAERDRAKGRLEQHWVKKINGNPSLYDDMLAFFRSQMRAPWTQEAEVCYVYPVGGTPAANMGLMLAAIERFGDRCITLYLPEGESHPVEMDLGGQMRRSMARRMAEERLTAHSFSAAIPLLGEASAPTWTVELARYASHRYHFDFDSAAAALERAKSACADEWRVRASCEELRRGLLRLRDRDPEALLAELYHNAHLAYEREEFAAFLGILFRFQEGALRYAVEVLYPGVPTEVYDEDTANAFQRALQERPWLLAYLRGKHLNPDKPNRWVLQAMLQCAWDGQAPQEVRERSESFRLLYERLGRLDSLAALRNKSIVAHGFDGVSRERIEAEYRKRNPEGSPLEDMVAALEILAVSPGEDPFQAAAKLALEGLR